MSVPARITCPECESFNDAEAAFCSQCGGRLSRGGETGITAARLSDSAIRRARPEHRQPPPPPGRGFRRALLLLGSACALILALTAGLTWLQKRAPDPDGPPAAGGEAPLSGDAAGAPEIPAPAGADEPAARASEVQPLSPRRLRDLARAGLIQLEIFDEEDREIGKVFGVLLAPEGTALVRKHDLMGAYRARCPLEGNRRPLDVLGVVMADPARDLALVRLEDVEPASGNLPALQPLSGRDAAAALSPRSQLYLTLAGSSEISWALPASVSDNPYYAPSFGGPGGILSSADQALCLRLGAVSGARGAPLFVLDGFGLLAGLARLEPPPAPGAAERVLVDPLGMLEFSLDGPVSLQMSEFNARYFEGTYLYHSIQARKAIERKNLASACDNLLAALDRGIPEAIDRARLDESLGLLKGVFWEYQAQLRQKNLWREMGELCERAVQHLGQERDIWLLLARADMTLESYKGALEALREVRKLQAGSDADLLMQDSYLKYSQQYILLGDSNTAAQILADGLQALPGSALLHLELAKIYQSWESYDLAVRYFQAARQLDPALTTEVQLFLDKIDDAMKRKDSVIIPIPEGATSLQTDAVVNGKGAYRFIIDTGASMTSISSEVAAALGYQPERSQEWVSARTANGVIRVPVIQLHSLSIQGYSVRDLKAMVLDDRHINLIGLNFLSQFKFSMDSANREFRLERK